MFKTGKFITIEGVEGVGKSTNIQYVDQLLDQKGIEHLVTREPGGTPLAEAIREILLHRSGERVDPMAELLLMFAARSQHLAMLIKPALAQGKWVLCDRFTDATYAYQGGGRALGVASIELLEQLVHPNLQPDLTFILDLDPVIGMQRVSNRGVPDRIESEQLRFFQAVRKAYLDRAHKFPERCVLIDASRSLTEVQTSIRSALGEFCSKCT